MRMRLLSGFVLMGFCTALSALPIQQFQLSNGLTVVIEENHRSPVVFTSVWYKVGGSYEPNGISGISHLLEHMMFRGTPDFPADKYAQLIANDGGEQNAMTDSDYTVYFTTLPANKLSIALNLEADRMQHLALLPADFSKELKIVMEERRMRVDDNPQSLTYERFNAAAYLNNPYHQPVVGWMTDLQNMQLQNLRHWYERWYAPNNAILIIVGDVQTDQTLKLVKHYFNNVPKKSVGKLNPRTEVTALGDKTVNVYTPAKLPLLIAGFQAPSYATTTLSWQPYALQVLDAVMGGSSGRLQNDWVEKQNLAVNVSTSYDADQLHSTQWLVFAIPGPQKTMDDLMQSLFSEIKNLQTKPISADELQRAKMQLIASHTYNQESLSNQAFALGGWMVIGLPWQMENNWVSNINAVTAAQVQAVANQFLINQRLTVGILHPLKSTANTKDSANGTIAPNSTLH